MSRIKNKNEKGFTLVETLIYMALIGVVVSSFLAFGTSLAGLRNKTRAIEEVESSSDFALDFLAQKIRQAESVDIPAKGASSAVLRLIMPGGPTITFATGTASGALEMTENGGPGIAISSARIDFPTLNFTNLGEPGRMDSIMIEMKAEFNDGSGSVDQYHSAVKRTAVNTREKL